LQDGYNLSSGDLIPFATHSLINEELQQRQGIAICSTYVMRFLQMLEASRHASRFADRIEYAIFAHA